MNARVLLLFLVSAFFMAAWNGDQQVMQQAYARREAARNTMLASHRSADSIVPMATTSAEPAAVKLQQSAAPCLPDTVPLPPGIAPGRYQAVNAKGAVADLKIDVPRDQHADSAVAHDFYVTDDPSGNRWYLIRIADRTND